MSKKRTVINGVGFNVLLELGYGDGNNNVGLDCVDIRFKIFI